MNAVIEGHRDALKGLCQRYRVNRLDVFGSAAQDEFIRENDIDFLVEMVGAFADRYLGLADELVHLFGRRVDHLTEHAIRNPYLRRGIEREFEIIGEVLARVTKHRPALTERLPEVARIVAFRNRIIHGYDAIDVATVWGVAQDHLPALVRPVEGLLGDTTEGE